jgi:hypothetical protein
MPTFEIRFNVQAEDAERATALILAGEVDRAFASDPEDPNCIETTIELSRPSPVSDNIGTPTSGTKACRFERPSLNIVVWPDRGQIEIWTRGGKSFTAVGDDAEATAKWLRDNLTIPFLQGRRPVSL